MVPNTFVVFNLLSLRVTFYVSWFEEVETTFSLSLRKLILQKLVSWFISKSYRQSHVSFIVIASESVNVKLTSHATNDLYNGD